MINRVEDRFGIKPKHLIGDTAYGTAAMLNWIVGTKQIEPHTPVRQKYEGTAEQYGMADFILDAETDRHTCPAGKTLKRYQRNFKKLRTGINKDNNTMYAAIQLIARPVNTNHGIAPRLTAKNNTKYSGIIT
jgi:hypothetical protein